MQHTRDAGMQAWYDGRGERDCPHIDCTEDILEVGYWNTAAAKRQLWLEGFRLAARMNEVMR